MKTWIRSVFRCIPASVRRVLIPKNQALVRYYARHVVGLREIYGEEFVKDHVASVRKEDSKSMAEEIYEVFTPVSLVDVGCCSGDLLEVFRDLGVEAIGVDFSEAAEHEVVRKKIPFFRVDLESDSEMQSFMVHKSDVVICFEVAEHLPAVRAQPLVHFLTTIAPVICFSAAPPGQGGVLHYNEQQPEYWLAMFGLEGFGFDATITASIKSRWSNLGLANPAARNFMVFRKA